VTTPVRAAGGIVWRIGPSGAFEVAVVHRPTHGDWTLPKGKPNPGETEEQTALREVEEETGMRCILERPVGKIQYVDRRGRPKTVRYWLMRPVAGSFTPSMEVDELRWVPLKEAAGVLTYQHDRWLLRRLAHPSTL
jgi:8-oxo-dGTP diphosphatase